MESPPHLHPGASIKHYELIRELGAGGMGTVFLARDTRLGRLVAIKLLHEQSGPAAERFLAEARATARCRHENIVVIYDVDEHDGSPYMVLEYIEGRTLRALLAQRGQAAVSLDTPGAITAAAALAVDVLLPVSRALAFAHELGIVHRDLKPENILVADSGEVKVFDFGIAKLIAPELSAPLSTARASRTESSIITQDGALVGTMPYMSPEQWLGESIDARADIWAAGIILYEILSGAHPLEPITFSRLMEVSALDIPMPSAHQRCPSSGALAAVIDRCLKKYKDERFASARDLVEALEPLSRDRGPVSLGVDESPFAGLAAFQESDAGRFFGRESDVTAVLGRLRNQQLVAVAGPSGAGKSSFVRAGVIPGQKRVNRHTEAFVLRPGRRPVAALAEVLAQIYDTARATDPSSDADPETIAATLRSQPGYLGARLRARCRFRGADHRIVLFVDQLEELYTLGTEAAERAAFCACLEGVADDASSPLRLVLTIRADFLDRLADDRRFMDEVTRGLIFLPPMGREGLRDALKRPLQASGVRFEEEALIDEMLDALAGTSSPLPLLQFTATKLWEARDRERRLLTRDGYRALGGVAGALSTHADSVLAGLSSAEQQLARSILVRLVTPERTRAIVRMDELIALASDSGAATQVVQHLAAARLLLIDSGGEREDKTVEIIHESLIERWSRLRQWLDENEQDAQFVAQLRNAAQQWTKNGEAEGLLWRDRAALEAGQWLERCRAEPRGAKTSVLGKQEERYLHAVVALAERTRRWRRRVAAAVIGALSVIAVVVSSLALYARGQARNAQEEARQARNATRLAAAREMQNDPTTALALLRDMEPPDVPRGWPDLTRSTLYAGVARRVLVHAEGVRWAAWSPDGKRIVTAANDKVARVWSADGSGEPLVERSHEAPVLWAAWSADGKRIVTTSSDRTARVWNADGSGEPVILRGHEGAIRTATFSPDNKRIVTASWDKTARIWSADGAGEPVILRGHEDWVQSAAWSPDSRRIVTASKDRTARVWSADGGAEPVSLKGHEGTVVCADWSPDGKRIVTASRDKTARVWSADGSAEPVVLRGHEEWITSASWSPDGARVVTTSADRTARVWSADGAAEPVILRGHEALVGSAAFSPDGKRVITSSEDRTARVWNADGSGDAVILRGHEDRVTTAAWSPDSERIVTASNDRTARLWSADAKSELACLRGHEKEALSIAWSPDGSRLVTASKDKAARVWSAAGPGEPLVLRGHDFGVNGAAWSPDSKRIVTASQDNTARIWSAGGSGEPLVLRGHDAEVVSAAWSPDGARIVTASRDNTARIWGAGGAGEPLVLRGHEQWISAAAWSPDGKRIVTASFDNTARIWSADGSGEPIVLRGHEEPVWMAVFSPDGKRIVTASQDRTARAWNADGSGEPLILRGHENWVNGVAWSPDGKRIVTASQDKTVRVWSAESAGEPLVLRGAAEAYNKAEFSPDGKRIAAASDDHTISVWADVEPLRGATDPRLWLATTYCIPVERRVKLLGLPDAMAQSDQDACLRRVAETHKQPVSPTADKP